MSLPNLFYFYRRRLRARLVQELFALIGIAVGVALLFAVQVSNTSLNASIAQLTHGIVGRAQLQVVARDPHGFDQRLARTVARQPGVRAVAPLLIEQANIVSPHGQRAVSLLAADPRLAQLGGSLLHGYTSGRLANVRSLIVPAPIARELGLQFGSTIRLEIAGRSISAPVGAVVGSSDVGPLTDVPAVVTPLDYGQTLANLRGRISRLYVWAAPERRAQVEATLRRLAGPGLDVLSSDSDTRVFAQATLPNNQSTALFAGISALVGFLFAFNAMLLMARERRQIVAELRMSGFGLPTVIEVLVFDALVLGTVASLLGLGLGNELSRRFFHPTPGYLSIAFPVGTARTVEWQTVAITFGAGLVAATLAAVMPLTATLWRSAIDDIDTDGVERGQGIALRSRWLLASGVSALLGALLVFAVAPQAALAGTVLLLLSMLLTLPAILALALSSLHRARVRVRSVVPLIAIGELLSTRSRSVALAAIAATAVFATTAIGGARVDLQRGLDPNAREVNAVADLWVSPAGTANTLATDPFDPAPALRRLRASRIDAIRLYRGGFLDLGTRRVWVLAPSSRSSQPFPPSQVVSGDGQLAAARIRMGGWMVVSEAIAREHGLHVGSAFRLQAPRPTTFRVAAITTNFGWSPGTIVVNADDYRRAWGSSDVSALQVDVPGHSPEQSAARVARALGPSSGLMVQTARQRERQDRVTTREGLSRLSQIAALVLTAASLAIAAAMGGMVWQRRRRLAELKLAGVGHRQLWRALLLESALLLAIGSSIGASYGLFGEQLLDRALNHVTGFPVDQSLGVPIALTSFGVVVLLALAIATLPGYLAARVPAGAAFQD